MHFPDFQPAKAAAVDSTRYPDLGLKVLAAARLQGGIAKVVYDGCTDVCCARG